MRSAHSFLMTETVNFAPMYSKEEHKQMKLEFWNEFKTHMQKIRSSNGRRINWINYPSEIKDLYIRVDADGKGTRLRFDIQSKDAGVRAILWEQLQELKVVMEQEMGTEGKWIENAFNAHVSSYNSIVWERNDLNFFHKEDHPEIMLYLQDRLVHFDLFYQEFKDILINLAN